MNTKYIIDSNILIRYPQIFSNINEKDMLIPQNVMDELNGYRSYNNVNETFEFVTTFLNKGVELVPTPVVSSAFYNNIASQSTKLSFSDIATIHIALDLSKKFHIVIVTDDIKFAESIKQNNIETITGEEFLRQSTNTAVNLETLHSANKITSSQKRHLLINLITGVLSSILGGLIVTYINLIVSTITVWGTLIMILFLGIFLFWFRENYKLSYGIFEFIVGFIMVLYVFYPLFEYSKIETKDILQILAGLYVMVRGMDNISKAIIGTRLEVIWKKVF